MPSRCDSETPYCRVTSDWHPRLSHTVALRLCNSLIVLRLNCEAMPCNSLERQSEVRSNRDVGVAEQRHTCPPLCDHNNSDRHIEHERSASQRGECGDGKSGSVDSYRPVGALRGQHAAFHGLTPMATPCRRSAAESQNAWLAGLPNRGRPSTSTSTRMGMGMGTVFRLAGRNRPGAGAPTGSALHSAALRSPDFSYSGVNRWVG